MVDPQNGRAVPRNREGEVWSKSRLLLILRLNLAVLVLLAVLLLVLPLSGGERWTILPAAAVFAGFNWAALDLLARR